MMRYCDFYASPHGQMLLVAADEGLSGVYFDGQKYLPQIASQWRRDASHATLRQAKRELAEYFGSERKRFDVALAPEGTPFQRSVWKAISSVGFGQTISYGELANRAGCPQYIAMRSLAWPDATRSGSSFPAIASSARTAALPDTPAA